MSDQSWRGVATEAVRQLAARCDLILVVGSVNSSNSNRLRELAEREGVEAHLIDGANEIDPAWVKDRRNVGVTAPYMHDGSMATLHSNSPRECLARMENMVMMGDIKIPKEAISRHGALTERIYRNRRLTRRAA